MKQGGLHRLLSFRRGRSLHRAWRSPWSLIFFIAALSAQDLIAQERGEEIEDITGKYEVLGPHDTLALLEDAGGLNGYIDVFQDEEESDDVLSYRITLGSRKDRRVEIKTATIHRRYYRFKGAVERGKGREESQPDYLRLVGELETITIEGDSGEETVQKTPVVLKSLGRSADEDDGDDE